MNIDLEFRGEVWQVNALADGARYPTLAFDCWRRNSTLEPLRAGDVSANIPTAGFQFARRMHLHENRIVATEERLDMASTQVVGDKSKRLYYVDNELLQHLPDHEIPTNFPTPVINGHRVGIDPPPGKPNAFAYVDGDIPLSQAVIDATPSLIVTAFVYTYVNKYGEESAPSRPSNLTYVGDPVVKIDIWNRAASTDPDVVGHRVYMLVGGDYFRVSSPEFSIAETANTAEIPNITAINDTSILTVNPEPQDVLDLLISDDWDPPPAGMKHLASIENGMLAVASDDTVYISEPYYWHAFPIANRWPVSGTVQRIAAVDGGLAILTDSDVRFLVGSTPDTMQELSRRYPHSISDPDSLCEIDSGLVYATHDGIALLSLSGGDIVTDGWIGREAWQAHVKVDEVRIALYDGRLLLATRNPETNAPVGYALNLAAQEATTFAVSEETLKLGFWRDPRTNECVYVDGGNGMKVFNAGTNKQATWESGDIVLPRAVNLTSARVEAENYPVTLTVSPEGHDPDVITVDGNYPFRIGATDRARRLRVTVSSSHDVAAVRLATDMRSV